MFWWLEPQIALPAEVTAVGRKPPWNQPQVTPLSLSRSPTFLPDIVALPEPQSSSAGSGSPTIDESWMPPAAAGLAPCVVPAMRLSAPGVEGPNELSKKLSLSVKFWARFHSAVTVLPSK